MPEGDTIFRAARTLHRALAGKPVTAFESIFPALNRINDDAPIAGRTIERVHSTGKHLLIRFSGDLVLRTHMRMNGSWHIYRRGEKWQRPRRDMRIVVATADFEAVGFNIPVAEFLSERAVARSPELRALGPGRTGRRFRSTRSSQICANAPTRRSPTRCSISASWLDSATSTSLRCSSCAASIRSGACRNSRTSICHRSVEESRRVLKLNVSEGLELMTTYGGLRRTTGRSDPKDRLWVYGRARLPCRRCGTPIRVRKQGHDARLTYWCPQCQPSTV